MTYEGFTAPQVSRFSGCTSSQLRYWDQVGLIQPSVQQTGGVSGRPRLYSFTDLVMLRAVKALRDEGMSIQRIRRAWGYLRRHGILADESDGPLVIEGLAALKTFAGNDDLLDALRDGQLMLLDLLDTGVRSVEEDPTRFDLDRDRFLGYVRDAERRSASV